jgi:hypothetical protein
MGGVCTQSQHALTGRPWVAADVQSVGVAVLEKVQLAQPV